MGVLKPFGIKIIRRDLSRLSQKIFLLDILASMCGLFGIVGHTIGTNMRGRRCDGGGISLTHQMILLAL